MAAMRPLAERVRAELPRGGLLPTAAWQWRHRRILGLLWLHVIGFAVYALLNSSGLTTRSTAEVGVIAGLAAFASWSRVGREGRTALASMGLIASSALLVHLSEGVIEMHFHFFAALAVIALYEDWVPFLLALGYVIFDRGLIGASFVLAASIASVIHWRLSEAERERATLEQAERVRAEAAHEAAEREITACKQVEARLYEQAATLAEQARLLNLAQDAIFVIDLRSGAIRFWNRGAEELYGWDQHEVLGKRPQSILQTEFPRPFSEILAELARSGRWDGELSHTCRDGTNVVVASRWVLQESAGGQPATVMAINSNITEQKRAQQALEYQALHDALTGLPNRVLLGNRLQTALDVAQHSGTPVALLMLDLDRFKDVNDTLGHEWGDRLLCDVGPRLQSGLRDSDTLARLGGDEFAVLLPATSASAAEVVARKLLQTLEWPFDLEGSSVTIGGSIGVSLFPEHGADAEMLLRCADVAMYVAKRTGNGHAVYVASQDQHSRDRLAVATDLRRAIESDELVLHFQPKLMCQTGELAGVEALVRWEHPQRGLLAPDQFIPLAEQTAVIGPLGRKVLELALRQSRAWHAAGLQIPVAVNLSMREVLDPELPKVIERLLVSCEVPRHALRVEITESSLMVDPVRARVTLERLCEMGVKLSVDDYGTGYSSLRYLQQLPVDELKIDRSFVRHMVSKQNDFAIVCSTIDLAHRLGLKVVAEGVEDAETWERLAEAGCDQAQGYYMSRPVPASGLARWLQTAARDWRQAA